VKPKSENLEIQRETWKTLGFSGAVLAGLCLILLVALQPMSGTVFQVILMWVGFFPGLGLLLASAIARFMDIRPDWQEE